MPKNLTWSQVEDYTQELARQIRAKTFHPDFYPESIVAIGRGGCIPAAMLAHELGIKTVDYINYSRKAGHLGDTIARLENNHESILFIDDATETGGTFKTLDEIYIKAHNRKHKTAVLVSKYACPYKVDFIANIYTGDAPIMPWERK